MARRKTKASGPIKKWWLSKHEYHYQAYTGMTLLAFAIMLYSFILFFFTEFAQEASQSMVSLAWVGLLGGALALFFVAPEFFYFFGKRQTLSEILTLDSRAEVMRRRKEAEIAADLLGKPFQSRLKSLYERLGISIPKRYVNISSSDEQGSRGISEEE
ncbi:MAG: hypothetical protein CMB61_06475 [Euryarchaeota archaeon]|nr:hypothetical protein [Euryarchaeota archaeon]|tara:strand:+ start:986 stop:1459 length:474 start_codon:yes stop_codon:yes gene_type:complete